MPAQRAYSEARPGIPGDNVGFVDTLLRHYRVLLHTLRRLFQRGFDQRSCCSLFHVSYCSCFLSKLIAAGRFFVGLCSGRWNWKRRTTLPAFGIDLALLFGGITTQLLGKLEWSGGCWTTGVRVKEMSNSTCISRSWGCRSNLAEAAI